MSLEQALADNTAALIALTAVMSGAKVVLPAGTLAADAAAPAAAPTTRKPRSDKGTKVAVDEPKTRYFKNTKHNTVFKREPTEPQVDLPDTVEIDEATFTAAQSAAATAASGPASAESSTTASAGADEFDPFADADSAAETAPVKPVIDRKTMTEMLMALHKLNGAGNAAIAPILKAVNAVSVPKIEDKDIAKVYELASADLAARKKAAA